MDWNLSNKALLQIATFSFLLFVIAEFIGASMSQSLSLFGDAAAMTVDVISYLSNLYAETIKERTGHLTGRTKWILEVFVPSFSVICLLATTAYITTDAIEVLLNPPASDDVKMGYLYVFSILNLFVDVICFRLFSLRGSTLFMETAAQFEKISLDTTIQVDSDEEFGSLEDNEFDGSIGAFPTVEDSSSSCCSSCFPSSLYASIKDCFFTDQAERERENPSHKVNLNMLSAFTHVGGDTLRTISVFLAALVSSLSPNINGDVCDAWAAILVSGTILLLVFPLIRDILYSARRICRDEREEGEGDDGREEEGVERSHLQENEKAIGGHEKPFPSPSLSPSQSPKTSSKNKNKNSNQSTSSSSPLSLSSFSSYQSNSSISSFSSSSLSSSSTSPSSFSSRNEQHKMKETNKTDFTAMKLG